MEECGTDVFKERFASIESPRPLTVGQEISAGAGSLAGLVGPARGRAFRAASGLRAWASMFGSRFEQPAAGASGLSRRRWRGSCPTRRASSISALVRAAERHKCAPGCGQCRRRAKGGPILPGGRRPVNQRGALAVKAGNDGCCPSFCVLAEIDGIVGRSCLSPRIGYRLAGIWPERFIAHSAMGSSISVFLQRAMPDRKPINCAFATPMAIRCPHADVRGVRKKEWRRVRVVLDGGRHGPYANLRGKPTENSI